MGEHRSRHRSSMPALGESAGAGSKVEDDKGVPPAILEDVKATFRLFDQDDSGTIDPKEIRMQMRGLGFEADNTTIYTFINDLDSDGSQTLEFEEFFSLMKDHLRIHEPKYNGRENVAEIFDFMDDPDPAKRNGRIDSSSLRWIASALGDQLSEEEIEAMVKGADRGGKGYVDPEDFYELMVRGASRPTRESPEHEPAELEVHHHRSNRSSYRHSLPTHHGQTHHGHSVVRRASSMKHSFRRSSSASEVDSHHRRQKLWHMQRGEASPSSSDAHGGTPRRRRSSAGAETSLDAARAAAAVAEELPREAQPSEVAGRPRGETR